jgi:hypothetical protein
MGGDATYLGTIRTWPAGDTDLSGLEYDWAKGVVLAVWDQSNVVRVLTPSGWILNEYHVPAGSNDEEGLGFDGLSLYIAEDPAPASEVWRYDGVSLLLFADGFESGDTSAWEESR